MKIKEIAVKISGYILVAFVAILSAIVFVFFRSKEKTNNQIKTNTVDIKTTTADTIKAENVIDNNKKVIEETNKVIDKVKQDTSDIDANISARNEQEKKFFN